MSNEREQPCPPPQTPPGMADLVQGYRWSRDTVGESGGTVYHLHGRSDGPDLFLKYGADAIADDVTDEVVRMQWLTGRMPVPAVVHFERTADEAWLLMAACSGKTAYEMLEADRSGRTGVVDALALFLRQLHEIPAGDCPFNSDHVLRLGQARARLEAGLIDEDDFDTERQDWSAERVWDELQALLPLAPDQVVTHGDFSLDNLIVEDGDVVGLIDVGRVGIADRYQDVAILWNCLGEFDPSLQRRFLQRYGIAEVDARKLKFHLLLDELF